jgi:hypothetical protein
MAKKSESTKMTLAEGASSAEGKGDVYVIDPKIIEAGGRDSSVLVGSRLCNSCQNGIDPSQFAPKVRFSELVKVMRSHCSNTTEYLDSSLPTMEIAFRLLLLKGNKFTSLGGIHDQISKILMNADWPRYISEQDLEKMLSHDTYYGIVHHPG